MENSIYLNTFLEVMKNIDLSTVDPDTLVDINEVVINTDLSREERIADFVRQIKNPYIYKCGKAIVKVSFADTSETLEDKLESYLLSLQ